MAPITNGRHLFMEPINHGYPQPGKTIVYDTSETIDLEIIALNGGVLIKVLVLSVDPYMRGRMRSPDTKSYNAMFEPGKPLANYGVGRVLKTEDASISVGDHVYGFFPFAEYTVSTNPGQLRVLKNEQKLPWSNYVGVCGMPGETAFYAWKEYAKPKKNEVVYVSTAAGAVGSIVVQLAKAEGLDLKVIGSTGSEEKVKQLKEIGVDVAFNYKTTNVGTVLEKEGPIDIYWDNVGGEQLDAALAYSAQSGRFIECGMISGYNDKDRGTPIKNLFNVIGRNLSMNGFIVGNLRPKYTDEFYRTVPDLVASGKLKFVEDITKGLENAGEAILAVQKGTNTGKSVILVADN